MKIFFVQFFCVFLSPLLSIFCFYFRSISFLSFIEPIFAWNVPLVSLIFLKRSLVFPILFFSSIYLHWPLKKALSLHAILWNSAFKSLYLSFSPLFFVSLLCLWSPVNISCLTSNIGQGVRNMGFYEKTLIAQKRPESNLRENKTVGHWKPQEPMYTAADFNAQLIRWETSRAPPHEGHCFPCQGSWGDDHSSSRTCATQ